ncbi:ribosomal protein S5-alanine N-acetyltransferase [Pseudomonas luteola]
MSILTLEAERVRLIIPTERDVVRRRRFELENREHLRIWEPLREETFYTPETVRQRIRLNLQDFTAGASCCFSIVDKRTEAIIGCCNFSNIIRGSFLACHLGYSIAESHQGKGFMFEAARTGIDYMFTQRRLHRIMANYIPHNERSARLLKRLGFEREGYARAYLKINGVWEDHVLNALINPASSV